MNKIHPKSEHTMFTNFPKCPPQGPINVTLLSQLVHVIVWSHAMQ